MADEIKTTRLKDIMSDYYSDVLEMNTILEIEQPELDFLDSAIKRQAANQFVLTCDEEGIKLWETVAKITPEIGQPLNQRRMAVLTKILPPKPITIWYLRSLLDLLKINAKLTVVPQEFSVVVDYSTLDAGKSSLLTDLLKTLLPANLTFTTVNRTSEVERGGMYVGVAGQQAVSRTNKDKGSTT